MGVSGGPDLWGECDERNRQSDQVLQLNGQDDDIIRLMRALDDFTPAHRGRLADGDRGVLCSGLGRVLAILKG